MSHVLFLGKLRKMIHVSFHYCQEEVSHTLFCLEDKSIIILSEGEHQFDVSHTFY